MAKIFVTGNAGSGKSSLSQRISNQTNIPLYSLDNIVWQPHWVQTPRHIVQDKINALMQNDQWVIGGVSTTIQQHADTIIFLDIPTYRCVYNIVTRFLKNGFKTRDELPENCPEYIGVFKALKIALKFNKNVKPKILQNIQGKEFIHIRSYAELNNNVYLMSKIDPKHVA